MRLCKCCNIKELSKYKKLCDKCRRLVYQYKLDYKRAKYRLDVNVMKESFETITEIYYSGTKYRRYYGKFWFVSQSGNVIYFNGRTNIRRLKPSIINGYFAISNNYIHHLVYETWISPLRNNYIYHKDGDKLNNFYTNLVIK